jgi:hypothetical protein
LKIVWTDEAIEHLEAIVTYVSVYDPAAARRLGRRLIELPTASPNFPIAAGTRERGGGR